jgi:tetratricopeptide (TPR) repeat protein
MTSQNRMQEALIHYERAESICSSKSTNLTEIYRQEFLINAALSRFDKAVAYIEKLRNQPNISESELAILQGYIELLRDDTESAKAWFDKAVETAGSDTAKARLLIAYSAYDCNYVNISHDIIYQMVVVEGISEFAEGWAFLTLCDFDLGLRHDFLDISTMPRLQHRGGEEECYRSSSPKTSTSTNIIRMPSPTPTSAHYPRKT